jgi:5-methylthioadenosine/S-adenosylhomocysteine deaminase
VDALLIKNVLLSGVPSDIRIEGAYIRHITPSTVGSVAEPIVEGCCIDGQGKAAIPGFVNTHTHAAMTLFRGFADDMPLQTWLEKKIWPNEARLTDEDVYLGAKLACLEMIRSGTTAFLDMYHHPEATALAAKEMGLRAIVSGVCFDHFAAKQGEQAKAGIQRHFREWGKFGERVGFSLGPHAIYTVSGDMLQWADRFAQDNGCLIQLHLAETAREVSDAIGRFGLSPVRYLHRLGVLSPRLIIAHALYVDDEEVSMLADNGVKVVHNPASNMKLASGYRFKFTEMRRAGITVGLGTDGCSSSNNLDMVEAMKLAALMGKAWRNDPEAVTADEVFHAATAAGADMAGLRAGRIAEGCFADICLVNLHTPAFVPDFNFVSNLVYAANGSCIDTVICNGRVLMENGRVEGEDAILRAACTAAHRLVQRN